jgi:HSP20 family protein
MHFFHSNRKNDILVCHFFCFNGNGIKHAKRNLKKEVSMTTALAKRQNGNQSASFGSVVDSIFQNSLRHFFDDNLWDAGGRLTNATVPVNIKERADQYELEVIAPGCKKEDFQLNINDNVLTISFESKSEKNDREEDGWVRNEFMQCSFSRSFTLDDSIDVNKIAATYTDGILRLTLPKNEKAKKLSRHIEVN